MGSIFTRLLGIKKNYGNASISNQDIDVESTQLLQNLTLFSKLDQQLVQRIKTFCLSDENEILFVTINDEVYYYLSLDEKHELNSLKELNNKNVLKFCSSYTNYFALTSGGSVYSWGNNEYGQLGCGHKNSVPNPVIIETLKNVSIKDICCGYYRVLLLTIDGDVYAIGRNTYGQIGNNNTEDQLMPIIISSHLFNSSKITAISCGYDHSVALNTYFEVYVWGDNSFCQLGIDKPVKQLIPQKLNASLINQIICGRFSTLMLSFTGEIYICGFITKQLKYSQPTKINKTIKYKEIAASPNYYLALALSITNECYVIGLCEKGKFEELTKNDITLMDEAFMYYLNFQVTYRNIHIESKNLLEICFEKWPHMKSRAFNIFINSVHMLIFETSYEIILFLAKDRKIYTLSLSSRNVQKPSIVKELENKEIIKITRRYQNVFLLTVNHEVYSFGRLCYACNGPKYNTSVNILELNNKRIIHIECGERFLLALSECGKLFAIEFIDNSYIHEITLHQIEKFISISCGREHCLALSENGKLYWWGTGGPFRKDYLTLIELNDYYLIKKICCYGCNSLFLTSDNDIYICCEYMSYNKTSKSSNKEDFYKSKPDTKLKNFFDIEGSEEYTQDFKRNNFTKLDTTLKFIDIEANDEVCYGLSIDNIVYILGQFDIIKPRLTNYKSFNELLLSPFGNYSVQVIHNISNEDRKKLVSNITKNLKAHEIFNQQVLAFTRINSRETTGFFVTKQDMAYTVRLNHSIEDSEIEPVIISELSNIRIKRVICSDKCALCLTESGKIFSFNTNNFSDSNDFTQTITDLNDKHIIEISCGSYHFLAMSKSGKVFAWGSGQFGAIGNGTNKFQETPIVVNSLHEIKIIKISCGDTHCLALSSENNLYGWGCNLFGQLGIQNFEDHSKPIVIKKLNNISIKKISCGTDHSLLLTDNNEIYSIGRNNFGQLGIGNKDDQRKMKKIETTIKFIDICTKWYANTSAALSQTGIYYIWGECGDEEITTPKRTDFTSFNAIFAKYSDDRFSSNKMNL